MLIKKITPVFIIFCFLMVAVSICAPKVNAQNKKIPGKARKSMTDGDKAFNTRDYRTAISKYTEATTAAPNYPDARFWKGYSHYQLKEYDEALSEFNLALQQNYSKPLDIYSLRWSVNFQKNNYDEALADVQKGLQIEPNNLTLLVALGDVSRAKKDYKTALNAYRKAVQLNPAGGDILYLIAESASNTGDAQEQGTAAGEAIKKGTKYVGEAYYLIGDSLEKSGKTNEALEAYQQSLASKDDIYDVYQSMAEIYQSQSRYKEAIDISLKALKFFPNDGKINTNLSRYYSLNNKNFDAIAAAQSAIAVLPESEQRPAYTNLCRAYNDTKQYQLAMNACNKALQISPDDGETNFYLGFGHTLTNRPNEAAKYYAKAVKELEVFTQNNPKDFDGFYLLGNAYASTNEFDKSVDAYKKSLELNPRFPKTLYNLGSIYKYQKKDDLALQQYQVLLDLDKPLAAKLKEVIDKK